MGGPHCTANATAVVAGGAIAWGRPLPAPSFIWFQVSAFWDVLAEDGTVMPLVCREFYGLFARQCAARRKVAVTRALLPRVTALAPLLPPDGISLNLAHLGYVCPNRLRGMMAAVGPRLAALWVAPSISKPMLLTILRACTGGLQRLNARGAQCIDDEVLAALDASRLEKVNLQGCWRITDTGLATVLEAAGQLTDAWLAGCSKLTRSSLQSLARAAPRLASLDFPWNEDLLHSDVGFADNNNNNNNNGGGGDDDDANGENGNAAGANAAGANNDTNNDDAGGAPVASAAAVAVTASAPPETPYSSRSQSALRAAQQRKLDLRAAATLGAAFAHNCPGLRAVRFSLPSKRRVAEVRAFTQHFAAAATTDARARRHRRRQQHGHPVHGNACIHHQQQHGVSELQREQNNPPLQEQQQQQQRRRRRQQQPAAQRTPQRRPRALRGLARSCSTGASPARRSSVTTIRYCCEGPETPSTAAVVNNGRAVILRGGDATPTPPRNHKARPTRNGDGDDGHHGGNVAGVGAATVGGGGALLVRP